MVKLRYTKRRSKTTGKSTLENSTNKTFAESESHIEDTSDVEYKDLGEPSQDTVQDIHRVMKLIGQERHLVAYSLYESITSRVQSDPNSLEHKEAKQLLEQHDYTFGKLKEFEMVGDNFHAYVLICFWDKNRKNNWRN
jgi:hypothetical protein